MKKINILYIIDYLYDKGGTERHLLYLLRYLDKSIYNCHVLAFDCGKTELTKEIKKENVDFVHIPVGKYYNLDAFKKALHIRRYILKNKIDIVQTFHFKADFYGALIAKLSGVRIIISSKRDTGDFKNSLQFLLTRSIKHIISKYIVVSYAVGKIIINREKVDKDRIVVIYNGVDFQNYKKPKNFEKYEARKELNIHKDDFVLGTVAWMRPEKNHKILFDSYKIVSKNIKNFKIVVVGGGPLLKYYREYIKENKLEKDILLVGPVNDVRKYLRVFDVACLLPSKNEGFSNAIIEKMAMGLPLIVSDIGGNGEAVIDGYNGYVIKPNDISKLVILLQEFYVNKDQKEIMGIRSINRVRSEFTINKMIEAHHNLYSNLVKRYNS